MNIKENDELQKKYDRKQGLFREMEAAAKKFQQLEQQAYYLTLTGINPEMIVKIPSVELAKKMIFRQKHVDLYVINGLYQPEGDASFERLVLQFVQVITKPKSAYGIIYNNVKAETGALNDFKKVLQLLPWQFLINLTNIYVLRPNFYSKASSWLSFGAVSNYLTSKTVSFDHLSELSKATGVGEEQLTKILPAKVISELERTQPRPPKSNRYKIMKQGLQKGKEMLTFQKPGQTLKNSAQFELLTEEKKEQTPAIVVKAPVSPSKQTIQQYEVGPTGAPIILEMLIYHISNNPDYLKVEGLFRKSVSIDDEVEILHELNAKNYDFLLGVTNPHLIANAIKRFISFFREPVIPYELFYLFMERTGDVAFEQIVIEGIKSLQKNRRMVIFVLFEFMRQKVEVQAELNRMNEKNLCIVLGPCLMYSKVPSMKDLIYSQKVIIVVSIIFRRYEAIFGNKQQREAVKRSSYRDYKRASIKEKLGLTKQYVQQLEKQQKEEEKKEEVETHHSLNVMRKTTLILHESLDRESDEQSDVVFNQQSHQGKASNQKIEPLVGQDKEVPHQPHQLNSNEAFLEVKPFEIAEEISLPLILPTVPVPKPIVPKASQQQLATNEPSKKQTIGEISSSH